MYGLADRIARSAIHQNHPTPVVELAPRGSIMVVDRDPAMLATVRSALEGSCHIVVARDAGEALSQIEWARPEAVLADAGLGADELDLLARGLAQENLGDIDKQSIAGAISTGTHGTGVNFGITGTDANGNAIANSTFLTGSPDISAMPVLTCDPRDGVSGDRVLNGACFSLPTPGSNGNYIFPDLRGPWYTNHDFAVFKNFPMGGSRKFQFRASFTNVFNHPQRFFDENTNLRLQYTNGQLSNTQFGILPKDNKYGRRIVQLAFKMYF